MLIFLSISSFQVQGNFDKVEFNRMCWTLCAKKNLSKSPLLISEEDAFKVWVIFNFLSEDKYPLIIVPEEVRNKSSLTPVCLKSHLNYVNVC